MKAIKILIAAPTPRAPDAPILCRIARAAKPPINTMPIAINMRSLALCLLWKIFVSDTSSHQKPVIRTICALQSISGRCVAEGDRDVLVRPKGLFKRMLITPCSPSVALMKPTDANDNAFVHVATAFDAGTGCPLFHAHIAAAVVVSTCSSVPKNNQARVLCPRRLPIWPATKAPHRKVSNEVRERRSARRKDGCWVRRPTASAIYSMRSLVRA